MLGRLADRVCSRILVVLVNGSRRHACATGDHDTHVIHSLWDDGTESELIVCDRSGCQWSEQFVYRPARVWDQEET